MQAYKSRQLDIACKLIQNYSGNPNLDVYLQTEFKKNKQFGSKDRRIYREICFQYFRHAASVEPSAELLEQLVNNELLSIDYNPYTKFDLSSGLRSEEVGNWLRQKPPFYMFGAENVLRSLYSKFELDGLAVAFEENYIKSLELINAQFYPEIANVQIMDLGSFSSMLNLPIDRGSTVWDACSGSGGKSLAIQRLYQPKQIVCSDVRSSVLNNLKQRFAHNGANIETKQMDASRDFEQADVIIVDAPCSGSGTWRRSPDRAAYFDADDLDRLNKIQSAILENLISKAASNTVIVYLTCSVFEQENEVQIQKALLLGVELISQEMVGGLKSDSDYLFRAVLKKR